MLLKSFRKNGVVCWSNSKNNGHLLACAGVQPNAFGRYDLDLLSLDIVDKSKELPIVGTTSYDRPFRSLAWDCYGEKDNQYPDGLIFGGMEDGTVTLWSAKELSQRNKQGDIGLVYNEEEPIIEYPIMCAEWNSLKPNLLGYGCSEVIIMDVGKGFGEDADLYIKPGNKNPHVNSYVTAVCWNKEVPHVMASASENGLIALWDIKTTSSIFQFRDNSQSTGSRNVSISWSKNFSTQIAVTLDDDNKCELQIWDLRNQKGPIVVIDKGHSKGLNTMDWCDSDPELILTGGRDNKIICWNYMRDQQIVTEVQMKEPVVDVKWSKKLPSIFSVATPSKVQIYSMNENSLYSYVPKWYKVPVGTAIGPSNQLVSYNERDGNVLTEYQLTHKTEGLSNRLKDLSKLTKENNYKQLIQQRLGQNEDLQFWRLAEVVSAPNFVESDIYQFLGFNRDKIIKEVEQYTGKKHSKEPTSKRGGEQKKQVVNFIKVEGQDAFDFFSSLQSSSNPQPKEEEEDSQTENVKYDMVPRNFNWDLGRERLIKQNLMIGNYGGAIDAALKCGRTAEALIIAYSQGQEIFNSTLKTFFTETTDDFIKGILKHIADKESEELIKKYQLASWKECIAFIYSMVRDQRSHLLKLLSTRLLQEQNSSEKALVCLVLAEDFAEILALLSKQLAEFAPRTIQRRQCLLKTVEKILMFLEMTSKEVQLSQALDRILLEASVVCFDEGEPLLAYSLLSRCSSTEKVEYLKCLIAHSCKQLKDKQRNPFKAVNIPVMKREGKKPVPDSGHNSSRLVPTGGLTGIVRPPGPRPLGPNPVANTPLVEHPKPKPGPPPPKPVGGFNPNQPQPLKTEEPTPPPKPGPYVGASNKPPPPPIRAPIQAPVQQEAQPAQTYQPQVEQQKHHATTPTPPPPRVQPPPPPPKVNIPPPPPHHQPVEKKISSEAYEPAVQPPTRDTPPPPPPSRGPPPPPSRRPPHQEVRQPQPSVQQQQHFQTYQAPQPPQQPQQQHLPTYQAPVQPQQQLPQQTPIAPPPARRAPPPPPRR